MAIEGQTAGQYILQWIHETSAPMLLAMVLALVPAVLALRARHRGEPVGERALLWLLAILVAATLSVLQQTWIILHPPSVPKVDPRFWAFLKQSAVLTRMGPALALGAVGALIAPELRRAAMRLLPTALVLTGWGLALGARFREMLLTESPDRVALWTGWMLVHTGVLVALALLGALALTRTSGPARWVVAAPLLPLLLWPSWVPWMVMVG